MDGERASLRFSLSDDMTNSIATAWTLIPGFALISAMAFSSLTSFSSSAWPTFSRADFARRRRRVSWSTWYFAAVAYLDRLGFAVSSSSACLILCSCCASHQTCTYRSESHRGKQIKIALQPPPPPPPLLHPPRSRIWQPLLTGSEPDVSAVCLHLR